MPVMHNESRQVGHHYNLVLLRVFNWVVAKPLAVPMEENGSPPARADASLHTDPSEVEILRSAAPARGHACVQRGESGRG